jgi:hypothetical protein
MGVKRNTRVINIDGRVTEGLMIYYNDLCVRRSRKTYTSPCFPSPPFQRIKRSFDCTFFF